MIILHSRSGASTRRWGCSCTAWGLRAVPLGQREACSTALTPHACKKPGGGSHNPLFHPTAFSLTLVLPRSSTDDRSAPRAPDGHHLVVYTRVQV